VAGDGEGRPRFKSVLSNRVRGERKKHGMLRPGDEPEEGRSEDVTVLDVSDDDPPRFTSKARRLIQQVREVDPAERPLPINRKPKHFRERK